MPTFAHFSILWSCNINNFQNFLTKTCLRAVLICNWQRFNWTALKALLLELTVAL